MALAKIFNRFGLLLIMAVCASSLSTIVFAQDGCNLSQPVGLPGLDLVNLLISTRRIEEENELGIILAEILRKGAWRDYEQGFWEQASQVLGDKFPEVRESLLLFWLQHLSANLKKKRRYSVNLIWAYNNFVQVLNFLQ